MPLTGYVGPMKDLARLEALATLGRLSAGLAHDINNALTYVTGNAELLVMEIEDEMERLEGDERRRWRDRTDRLRKAVHGLHHIAGVAQSLRDAGRPPGDAPAAEVRPAVQAVCMLAAPRADERGVGLRWDAPVGLVAAMPRESLVQALLNLTLNAIDAASPGGEVTIAASVDGSSVRLRVTDDGPGIAPEVHALLFQPFVTTKPEGTGLGLFVSRELVRAHGGALAFETGPEGTAFEIAVARQASV